MTNASGTDLGASGEGRGPQLRDEPRKVTGKDILAAAQRLRGQIVRTHCTRSRVLSTITGAEVWLKFENFQFTASFKERGALNKLLSLTDAERKAGGAAMAAGNHAQGVAYHATRLGIRSVIVMPKT